MAQITQEHIEAMKEVVDGADIYGYKLAGLLRAVEQIDPELIEITQPMMYRGSGADRVPYFGCILTDKGREFLASAEATSSKK